MRWSGWRKPIDVSARRWVPRRWLLLRTPRANRSTPTPRRSSRSCRRVNLGWCWMPGPVATWLASSTIRVNRTYGPNVGWSVANLSDSSDTVWVRSGAPWRTSGAIPEIYPVSCQFLASFLHTRTGLFTIRPVTANEELTINYIESWFLSTGLMGPNCLCLCGTDSCISTIRLPIGFQSPVVNAASTNAIASAPPTTPDVTGDRPKKSKKCETPERQSEKPTTSTDTGEVPAPPIKVETPLNTLLAAASNSSQASGRKDRALIQPASVAARVGGSAQKSKAGLGTKATGGPSSDVSADASIGIHPSANEDFCYRYVGVMQK